MATHPKGKKVVQLDTLDQAVKTWSTDMWAKMLLWKNRIANPEMTVEVTEKDILAWQECVTYLNIDTQLKIHRPQGRPAAEAIAAVPGTPQRPGRSAIPARPADPPRPFVLVQLLDQDGNTFKPIENNEQDRQRQEEAERLRRARDQGRNLATQLQHDMGSGVYSNATIGDAAAALIALSNQ